MLSTSTKIWGHPHVYHIECVYLQCRMQLRKTCLAGINRSLLLHEHRLQYSRLSTKMSSIVEGHKVICGGSMSRNQLWNFVTLLFVTKSDWNLQSFEIKINFTFQFLSSILCAYQTSELHLNLIQFNSIYFSSGFIQANRDYDIFKHIPPQAPSTDKYINS